MENKSCYNCKCFIRHYYIYRYRIRALGCGHCTKCHIKVKELGKFPFKNGCDQWEEQLNNVDESKELLTYKLIGMARDIHDIVLILKGNDGDN